MSDQVLVTPFTPDTAPPGLSVRRRWWVAPLLLIVFGAAAAAMQSSFPQMTYEYGRFIRDVGQDPSLLLPKQSSIAIRPLFACLLVLFALFAAGTWKRRLRLLAMSLGLYVSLTILVDVALARLSAYGGPSPFMAYGNVIAGLVGILVVAIAVFANARLPRDVRVEREMPLRWMPLFLLALATLISVAAALALQHFAGSEIHDHLSNVPLLGGSGSLIVIFFIALPMALCLVGAIAAALRRKPEFDGWYSVAFIVPARDEEDWIGELHRLGRRRR